MRINQSYDYTFTVTDKAHIALIKSALKPNRGQLFIVSKAVINNTTYTFLIDCIGIL